MASDERSEQQKQSDEPPSGRRRLSTGKILGGVGALIALAATSTGLLFELDPGLAPCLGNTSVSLTAIVIPGRTENQVSAETNGANSHNSSHGANSSTVGVEVSYTLATYGFRHHTLLVDWSLLYANKDGTLGPVAANPVPTLMNGKVVHKLAFHVPQAQITPGACSTPRGDDFFVAVPHAKRAYRILLEVFDGPAFPENRIALFESQTFRVH